MKLEEIVSKINVKPYFKTNLGVLYNTDCLDILKQMPEKCIDLCLTDPPYGIDIKYDNYEDSYDNWRKLIINLVDRIRMKAKLSILPCCRIKELNFIYHTIPPDWLICWYKGSPGHNSHVGFNDWEPHLVYGQRIRIMHDYFYAIPSNKNIEGHPCPKSIEYARKLVSMATYKGNLILDCFLGSGTTAVACEQLNRQWIGVEISEKYCEIAKKRIKHESNQQKFNF